MVLQRGTTIENPMQGQGWEIGIGAGSATGTLDATRPLQRGEEGNLDFQRMETVLIIEDDSELNRVLTRRLARAGLQAVSAYDGPSALLSFRQTDPDVVVLDLGLPGLDGFKFLHCLRHTPGLLMVPVLVVTGRMEKGLEERLAPMGVRRVLYKPLSLKRVVSEVVDAIEGI